LTVRTVGDGVYVRAKLLPRRIADILGSEQSLLTITLQDFLTVSAGIGKRE